ncbi:MAG: FAD-dependent oxidoreductase [Burkholderiales bacterium]|nr:FAD-dependent oxidoreductase [Phycisphaerae bacterium]
MIVVGAGIGGLTTAYLLAREGRDVILLDEGRIASGQSERTSAHLASIIDDRFSVLASRRDWDTARIAYQSHAAAIDRIETLCRDEAIDCDFARVDAYLFPGPDGNKRVIADELEASEKVGVADFTAVESVPGIQDSGQAIRYGGQGRFHPVRYFAGLADACTRRGVRIFNGRRVSDVQGAQPGNGEPARVTFLDNEQVITAHHVVVATNVPTPVNDWMGIYLKMAAYRTYMVGFSVPAGSIPDALYWDTLDPYHYARLIHEPQNGRDILITGGEDHKTGQDGASDERFEKLSEWTRRVFPQVGEEVTRWSGQVVETGDGLGFIGRAPTKGENVYVIAGDSGMGLTHGTLGAMLIADLIAGRENPWTHAYNPARALLNTETISEDANSNMQYADYLTPGEIKNESELAPGEGALMRRGLSKIAVYRDKDGQVCRMTAACPHMKGIVQWNPVEKSWDCPVHGSRFDCQGKMVMGPSFTDLDKIED